MILLMIILCFLLFFVYVLFEKSMYSPSFAFIASFCFASIWATAYQERWELKLHTNTFFVIIGGICVFIVASLFIHYLSKNNKKKEYILEKIRIENYKKFLLIIIEIFAIVYTIYKIVVLTNGSFSNISNAIYIFRFTNTFTDDPYSLPRIINILKNIIISSTFYFGYVIINNYFFDKRIDGISLIIIVLGIIYSMCTGYRTDAFLIILTLFAIYFIFQDKFEKKKRIDFKKIYKFIFLVIIGLFLFQKFGSYLGRDSAKNKIWTDYIAAYCGAEIKNLDIYLQVKDDYMNNSIWGSQTFVNIIHWLGPKLGIHINYKLDLPYNYINDFELGNVYTIFYPFIYDFGYMGVITLTALMAFISQIMYEKVKNAKVEGKVDIKVLVYGYIYSSLILSFFSNKFYEQIFSRSFVIMIILWYFINIFCCKIKIKK